MWPKSRSRRPAGFCGKQQREKNPVRKEETRPRSMSLLSEKTCPNNGGNLSQGDPIHHTFICFDQRLREAARREGFHILPRR